MTQQIQLGKFNHLEVLREVDFGLYLDAGEVGEVLLPRRYVPEETKVGDVLRVFLCLDSEERLVATTQQPLVEVGQFAFLNVQWTNKFGAFLDWGLTKDLFCPFAEQRQPMQKGERHLVYCYIDPKTYRILCSAKVEKFLSREQPTYEWGEAVDALIIGRTDLGYKTIIDHRFAALLFHQNVFKPLSIGEHTKAFIQQVRPDGKIDLCLDAAPGRAQVDDLCQQLLEKLRQAKDGFLPLHDKSPAEDIYNALHVSKKTFKQAVGKLYKQGMITLLTTGIRITVAGITADVED